MPEVKQAIIIAAGRGGRLGPWSRSNPKAMLEVDGKCLLQHQLDRLQQAGIQDIVVTVAHMSAPIKQFLKTQANDFNIRLSDEGPDPIGILPGIIRAQQYLNAEPFLLQSVDALFAESFQLDFSDNNLAKLYVYKSATPDFHVLDNKISFAAQAASHPVCYAGMGLYHPDFFADPAANFLAQIQSKAEHGLDAHLLKTRPRNINFMDF